MILSAFVERAIGRAPVAVMAYALGYPRAALFGFAAALVASNALAAVTAALAAAHPEDSVGEELSFFALGLESRQSKSLLELVAEDAGAALRELPVETFAAWLRSVAGRVKWTRYRKTGRGPKKPRPERPKCPRYRHVATKKLLDQQRAQAA